MPACKVAVIFRKYIGDTYSVSNKSNYISVTHLHAHPPVEAEAVGLSFIITTPCSRISIACRCSDGPFVFANLKKKGPLSFLQTLIHYDKVNIVLILEPGAFDYLHACVQPSRTICRYESLAPAL